jgi:hypothetical protein
VTSKACKLQLACLTHRCIQAAYKVVNPLIAAWALAKLCIIIMLPIGQAVHVVDMSQQDCAGTY